MKQRVSGHRRCRAEGCNQFITMNGLCKVHWVKDALDARVEAKLERSKSNE